MIRVDQDNAVYRILCEQTGSPRMVINVQTGAIAQEMEYDIWGNVLSDTNPGFQPFGFAGGLYDPETELVHFGAREYDPELGRWLCADPVGFNGGLNWYEYCNGDPINFGDPLGWGPSGEWFFGLGTAGELRDFVLDWWGHALPENWFGHIAFGMISVGTSPLSIGQQTAYASVNYDIQPWYTTAFQVGGDVLEAAGFVFGALKVAKMGGLFKASSPSVSGGASPPVHGGAGPVRVGQAGEDAVRGVNNIGDKVKISINGRNRIPDGLTDSVLSEVKNLLVDIHAD